MIADKKLTRHCLKSDASRRLADLLRARILAGVYSAGDRLPSEAEISMEDGAGRNVVRDALDLLRRDGYITRVQGQGTVVISRRVVHDLNTTGAIASDYAGGGNRVITVFRSVEQVPAPPLVARRLELAYRATCVLAEYVTLIDHEPYAVATSYLPYGVAGDAFSSDLAGDWFGDWHDVLNTLGMTIGRLDLHVEAVAADRSVAELLEVPDLTPLLRFERLIRQLDGRPLDFGFSRCRSDRILLRSESPEPLPD